MKWSDEVGDWISDFKGGPKKFSKEYQRYLAGRRAKIHNTADPLRKLVFTRSNRRSWSEVKKTGSTFGEVFPRVFREELNKVYVRKK